MKIFDEIYRSCSLSVYEKDIHYRSLIEMNDYVRPECVVTSQAQKGLKLTVKLVKQIRNCGAKNIQKTSVSYDLLHLINKLTTLKTHGNCGIVYKATYYLRILIYYHISPLCQSVHNILLELIRTNGEKELSGEQWRLLKSQVPNNDEILFLHGHLDEEQYQSLVHHEFQLFPFKTLKIFAAWKLLEIFEILKFKKMLTNEDNIGNLY